TGLSIKKCDLKITTNNSNHHTEEISTERLILRRGQPFTITLHFSSPVHSYLQQLKKASLTVQTGPHPSKADGTQAEFHISSLADPKQWSAALEEQDPWFWTISVNTPARAPIGLYTLTLRAPRADCHLATFTLLFNPWCQGDEVFLANEAQRQEYVLNQEGLIYRGTENAVLAQPWDFSQLEEDVVDICFVLLDLGERRQRDKGSAQRHSSLHICRTVAAMLTCDELRGILAEGGAGPCCAGTAPGEWLGSRGILQRWLAAQCKPVGSGQCWMVAAVLCTVLRCLGIPTRVVTGFTWAHNTNSSLSVDEYYDEDGTMLTRDSSARVWTFHVWNECWMARAALSPEYSGWQALDATLQVKDKGPSFCGPAPVKAIKEGDTEVDYDVCNFFAAINAKCQVWIQKADDSLEPALGGTKYIGNNISTKGVGSQRCEDVTHHYKHPEGSLQEKEALDKACRKIKELETSSSTAEFSSIPLAHEDPVNLFIQLQSKSSLLLGQDIPLSITVSNHSGAEKVTHLVVRAQSLHYSGVPIAQLWKEEFHFTLGSNEASSLQVSVPYSLYRGELGENKLLRLTAMLRDEDSFMYLAQEEISMSESPLTIEFPEAMVQYQPSTAKISLLNPLTEPLEKCVVAVTGRGLIYRQRKYRLGSVQPNSTHQLQILFTPTRAGPRRLTAHLTCLQLHNLNSCKTANIAAA
ncbi:EPB42 protein, partial [Psilopogon haemacephalus]|nr:EPB42 protein [Psilopogon haemacephalus]